MHLHTHTHIHTPSPTQSPPSADPPFPSPWCNAIRHPLCCLSLPLCSCSLLSLSFSSFYWRLPSASAGTALTPHTHARAHIHAPAHTLTHTLPGGFHRHCSLRSLHLAPVLHHRGLKAWWVSPFSDDSRCLWLTVRQKDVSFSGVDKQREASLLQPVRRGWLWSNGAAERLLRYHRCRSFKRRVLWK